MDRELAALGRRERCFFTRYADDLTFSTDRTVFPGDIAFEEGTHARAGPLLETIVNGAGFKINADKTRLVRRWQRQRVTGLIVNRQLNVPRVYIRELRNILYIWKRYGLKAAEESFDKTAPHPNWPPGKRSAPFADIVRGRVQHVGLVKGWDNPVYSSLATSLAALDHTFRYVPKSNGKKRRLYICTEGPTDVTHLSTALKHYHDKGEFLDLILDFDNNSALGSDSALQKHLASLPASKPRIATACLFDRDKESILKKERLLQDDFVDRGNGVVAAALVEPNFRTGPLCIEMLYPDAVLAIRDAEGRRIYLRSEFDEHTGHHHSEQCSIANPKSETLVREDVHEFGSGRPLALSKTAFANEVEQREAPFDVDSFDGFRPTLEMLRNAASAVSHKVSAD